MLKITVRVTEVSFIAFHFFVGNRETLRYGLNFGKFLIEGSFTVDFRSNILFRFIEFCTVYRRSKSATHFSVKSVVYIVRFFS